MKNNLKTISYTIFSMMILSLLTACGGGSNDSKSGSNSEFVGNWKSQCYSRGAINELAKTYLGGTLNTSINSGNVKIDITSSNIKISALLYSDSSCSNNTTSASTTCSYEEKGEKTSSGGKQVQKIDVTCPEQSTIKDIYLIGNGKLYFSQSGTNDGDGYPNQVFYDFYATK